MKAIFTSYLTKKTEAAPLAVFRVLFGLMMFVSIVRFWAYGWIEKFYIEPKFYFAFYGFDFVKPLGAYTYLLFLVCGLSAIMVMLGYKYRLAIISFFLSFTYIELIDKTTYLNHYYFISLLSFLLIFLPANAYFSIDAKRDPAKAFQKIPAWTIDTVKLLLCLVYGYAGIAKLNSEWLVHALPLRIWLPSNYHLPLLGPIISHPWAAYIFSWSGALYDLAIPFLLIYRKTRVLAFVLVTVFHVMTGILFPIGMFPYIMILSTLIFFDARFHHSIISKLSTIAKIKKNVFDNERVLNLEQSAGYKIKMNLLIVFFALQFLLPFRYLLYPGELFWTEEGYRFSWRVMLMEKGGYVNFKIVDGETGKGFYVVNTDFLHPQQEKQMATQPDFMLSYAHFLADHFQSQGHKDVQVFAESYVSLNGRRSRPYIDPTVDLAQERDSFKHKTWILPFEDEIKGL